MSNFKIMEKSLTVININNKYSNDVNSNDTPSK